MDNCVGGDLEVIRCRKNHKCVKLSNDVRAYYAKKGLAGLQFHPRDLEVTHAMRLPLRVSSRAVPGLQLPLSLSLSPHDGRVGGAGPGDQTVSTVKYEANTLVFFVNSNQAFHAVTRRSPTPYPRRFVNIVAQLP
jgi:hypothetical protein